MTRAERELNTQNQIKAMRGLGFTEEEIADVLKCDDEIEHGADLFALSPEKEAISREIRATTSVDKKNARAEKKKTVYNFNQRERKENFGKQEIISLLADTLNGISTSVEITNKERELIFVSNGVKYRLTLAVPRK